MLVINHIYIHILTPLPPYSGTAVHGRQEVIWAPGEGQHPPGGG